MHTKIQQHIKHYFASDFNNNLKKKKLQNCFSTATSHFSFGFCLYPKTAVFLSLQNISVKSNVHYSLEFPNKMVSLIRKTKTKRESQTQRS